MHKELSDLLDKFSLRDIKYAIDFYNQEVIKIIPIRNLDLLALSTFIEENSKIKIGKVNTKYF